MKPSLEILDLYASAFREMVNERVWGGRDSPAKLLRLNSEADWSFICVAMDVVGDASLALANFLRFAVDGPARYDDAGEKYLRLYGMLSATYLQQEALLKLYSLLQCPNPSTPRKLMDALEVRKLRHQIAAHSVDYRNPNGGPNQAFVPVRVGLEGFACEVTRNRGDESFTVQLDQAIHEHCKAVTGVLDQVFDKSIRTFYRGQESRIQEFAQKLEDLRFERSGNLLIRATAESGPLTIRVIFVPSPERDGERA